MRRGAAGMLRPFAARGAPTAASFGSYAARWTVRAVTPTHVPSGSVCARYRATYAAFARAQKCTCQIESRAVLRCMRRGPSKVSSKDLYTYIGGSGRAKSLLSGLICSAARPVRRPRASATAAARRTSATYSSVTGRPILSRGGDRKVGLPIIPLLPGPARRSRLTTTPRIDA